MGRVGGVGWGGVWWGGGGGARHTSGPGEEPTEFRTYTVKDCAHVFIFKISESGDKNMCARISGPLAGN